MEVKKNKDADVHRKRGMYLNIGLVVALTLAITAFQWRTFEEGDLMDLGHLGEFDDELIVIPPTEQPPPVKPEIVQPEIVEVDDEEDIPELEIKFDVEVNEDDVIEDVVFANDEPEEVADEVFDIVEEQPTPIGGMSAFNQFLRKNLKYPSNARRMGIEGKVFVQFVVDKNGKLNEVKVIKGIGAGCDEEAIRVLKAHPNWKPGKQRGRAVKVRMVVPIYFKLG